MAGLGLGWVAGSPSAPPSFFAGGGCGCSGGPNGVFVLFYPVGSCVRVRFRCAGFYPQARAPRERKQEEPTHQSQFMGLRVIPKHNEIWRVFFKPYWLAQG